jgi:hypothetical protein
MGTSLKDRLTSEYIAPCEGGAVYLYRVGPLSMSVCAPGTADAAEVARAINRHYPCGTEHGWVVSQDTHFLGGETNPCTCEESPERKHWLIDC